MWRPWVERHLHTVRFGMDQEMTVDREISLSVALRAVEVWLVISAVETIHGVVRVALLAPAVGDFRGRQIGVFTGSLLILAVAFLFRNWTIAATRLQALFTGAIWVLATTAFEVVLGRAVMNLEWNRLFEDYDIVHGGLMPIGLLLMLFAPMLVSSYRSDRRDLR